LVYPADGVLLPPNLNVLSVQWSPYGSPFQRFSVDFTSTPNLDWHLLTSCAAQTIDAQSGTPSAGCELTIDPVSWSKLVNSSRCGGPITITVRGTTDGRCASTSTNSIRISFAEQDLIGTYYYWKSTVSPNGVGGQIWRQTFGDLNAPEQDVTTSVVPGATCNGCHALSRDGSRMVVYSDDNDSDDEYSDVGGSLLDMTTAPPTELANGVSGPRQGGQPPGLFDAFGPLAAHYVSSNGIPLTDAGAPAVSTSAGFPSTVPVNGFSLWNGQSGAFVGGVTIGTSGTRPTMPDWSVDGTSLVYVLPSAVAAWDADAGDVIQPGPRSDDDHIFGGSLYTVPYASGGLFGTPALVLQSRGENNYYPSYSPDLSGSLVIFNRAALDTSVGALTGCSGTAPQVTCPNDSFSNPAARLMVLANGWTAPPIDLERANGSPVGAPMSLSNSYPRWAPFVQSYRGRTLLWFTFSSTRDYGLRVLNHKPGMYQCYPPDSYELPGAPHGQAFAAECRQPQLWMSAVNLNEAQAGSDPSRAAFWVPYQDIATHNHTAQWTQQMPPASPSGGCTCSKANGPCGPANTCGCCAGEGLACSGNMRCVIPGAN
jgi:hypothetical protein